MEGYASFSPWMGQVDRGSSFGPKWDKWMGVHHLVLGWDEWMGVRHLVLGLGECSGTHHLVLG